MSYHYRSPSPLFGLFCLLFHVKPANQAAGADLPNGTVTLFASSSTKKFVFGKYVQEPFFKVGFVLFLTMVLNPKIPR